MEVGGTIYQVNHGTLETQRTEDVWRLASEENDAWLDVVKQHTFKTFGEIGKIRVGVKTTADNVFIGNSSESRLVGQPKLIFTDISEKPTC